MPRLSGYRSGHRPRAFPPSADDTSCLPSPDFLRSGSFSYELNVHFRVHSACFLPPVSSMRPRSPARDGKRLWGFRVPSSRHLLVVSTHAQSTQLRATFRPRRSSRPRRLAPPRALWVCFAPQPRPGFSLQGVDHIAEPYRVSPASYPPAVSATTPANPKTTPAQRPAAPGFCSLRCVRRFRTGGLGPPERHVPPGILLSSRHRISSHRRALTHRPPTALSSKSPSRMTRGVLTARNLISLEPD
jgi:hypothetical protein